VLVASNLVLLLAVLGLGILALASGRDTEDDVRSPWVTRLLVDIDPSTLRNPPALSANGEIIAWPAEEGVRVQSFDRLESRLIPGTAGARSVGISVDGRELSYIMDRELRTVPVDGGAARTLADRAAPILQTIWSDDDWIYFKQLPDTPDQRSVGPLSGSDVNSAIGMARVHARTGTVEIIEIPDTMPAFVPTALLPDGRHLLLTLEASSTAAESAGDEADLVIGVLDRVTGGLQVLTNGTIPRYEPSTGHLLFKRDETLMAVPMDAERIELTGPEFAVAESIGHFGIARDGTLWYVLGPIGRSVPVLLDRRGRPREILPGVIDQYDYSGAYFSPDGNRLVLTMTANGEDASNLWVYDLPDGPLTRLTFDQGFFPAWTLDGRSILFTRQPSTADSARVLQAGGDGVYRVPADATGPAERVLRADGIGFMQPTPDGGIVFELWNGSDYDIGHASLDGGDSIRMLVSSPANEEDPAISPDGRWLAWESDETGRRHVFVMPFGGPGRGRQVSIASGNNPFWSRSGEELFFYNDEQAVIEALRFRADSTFEVMARETLFSVGQFGGRYPPGPGDSVFLAQQSTGPRFNTQFVLVRNWIHELEARAAAAGR
jgi:serine/threonine-protein kinase